ncbi:aspartate kinase [Pontibacillus halophilus JSM 076056 = DSM 19796]|uniref:Aspartokinase n=1 Tax=Pontibacillus halophilus JSM 076056 = DSM 19796 TaxID=1385510 RepID=A0A0A5GI83_9BACI|nr:aspartate kinase [Pontibacillus halophilus]KGX90923.1 aspartate kinase [Pontibacillus halophilus JSM 076056 = DSM 19796]
MKVAKFGGSSVASASQLKKVTDIITQDPERKLVVVSAPGKRFADDIKVTDLLIGIGTSGREEAKGYIDAVIERFKEILTDLHLPTDVLDEVRQSLEAVVHGDKVYENKMDALKATGEDTLAKVLSLYLNHLGHQAYYVNPKEAGIIVSDEPGSAQVLDESFDRLYQLRDRDGILIIPGFFGYTSDERLMAFPRGGSDITGSIVAAGVKADLYENFTDVDSVYCVNPMIVEQPKEIHTLTYKEMRELSYAGFSVFHDEALIPAFRAKIPVAIKNTNNPSERGTRIVAERPQSEQPIVGIASDDGFLSIYVSKYLMNRERGFGRHLLQILEEEGISFEHAPSGIDDMSVILREEQLPPEKEEVVVRRITDELKVDTVTIERDLGMVMLVGEGMNERIGVAARASQAFQQASVNIEMINQGSSEVSMMFGIKENGIIPAVQALYKSFFVENNS